MIPEGERLKIDLHCHDENSDITDELLGRILRVPETWIKTADLVHSLKVAGCHAFTITNHNNARSCWKLLDKGEDILVGAEFTCTAPEYDNRIHVLTYGFTPEQEVKLNKYRTNLYQFMTYAAEHNLPTILPHPLFFYSRKPFPGLEFFEKLVLLFERFEVMNGQRDIWQNLLTWEFLSNLDEEKIDHWSKKHNLNPHNFCRHPYRKTLTGGSDDHMSFFAGTCGSYLHVPNLKSRLVHEKPSEIALDVLRDGFISPYGHVGNQEKLHVALLDYLSQLTLNMKEPGLLRMFLHHGTLRDKLYCLAASNIIQELKRHRFTTFFFKTLHESLNGKKPGILKKFRVTPDFKPIIHKIEDIAKSRHIDENTYLDSMGDGIHDIFNQLNRIIARRINKNTEIKNAFGDDLKNDTRTLIERFEIPTHFRSLFEEEAGRDTDDVTRIHLSKFFDQLSFPVLASAVIAGTSLISTRSLNSNRKFLNQFAQNLGQLQYPEKVLWLTDTLRDKNGVSNSLSAKLKLVQEHNLNLDFLVCSDEIREQEHLRVVKPVGRFTFPNYKEQTINVPDLLQVKQVFLEGGYDRIVCSTEFIMGPVALFLKTSFNVPTYFFLHTDWMEFIKGTTAFKPQTLDRVRRILRFFYHQFDGIFALNRDHRDWLSSKQIQYPKENIYLTSHWVSELFKPGKVDRLKAFKGRIADNRFVLLYAGRISEEKGVLELPEILKKIRVGNPDAQLVVAGVGPAESKLRQMVPDAVFLGWVEKQDMPLLYSSASLLVLPSKFDTFGNVILEAMSCGLPVAAYSIKGPRDIIESSKYGILADDLEDLAGEIAAIACNPAALTTLRDHALNRADYFSVERIMNQFLRDIKLPDRLKTKNDDFKDDIGVEEAVPGLIGNSQEFNPAFNHRPQGLEFGNFEKPDFLSRQNSTIQRDRLKTDSLKKAV